MSSHRRCHETLSMPCSAMLIKIIRHMELARQEAQPLLLLGRWAVDGRDAHHRLSGLGDDEAFTLLGASNQLREPRLGLMDVHGFHGHLRASSTNLASSSGIRLAI